MRVVELRRRRAADGATEILARIRVPAPGAPARIEAVGPWDAAQVERALEDGGVIGADGRELHPADGDAWLEALPWSVRGSRLWAELVDDPA